MLTVSPLQSMCDHFKPDHSMSRNPSGRGKNLLDRVIDRKTRID